MLALQRMTILHKLLTNHIQHGLLMVNGHTIYQRGRERLLLQLAEQHQQNLYEHSKRQILKEMVMLLSQLIKESSVSFLVEVFKEAPFGRSMETLWRWLLLETTSLWSIEKVEQVSMVRTTTEYANVRRKNTDHFSCVGNQNLKYTLRTSDTFRVMHTGRLPINKNHILKWIGISDEGVSYLSRW